MDFAEQEEAELLKSHNWFIPPSCKIFEGGFKSTDMKVEELLAQFKVRLRWCKGMEGSWEWLCITEVIFKEILSKKYSSIHIFLSLYNVYIYRCAILMSIYLPRAACSAGKPAPGQPVWLQAGWAALAPDLAFRWTLLLPGYTGSEEVEP